MFLRPAAHLETVARRLSRAKSKDHPAATWYFVPVAALPRSVDSWLSPHRPNSRYGLYKEAWNLLL